MLERVSMRQDVFTREAMRDDRGLLGLVEREMEYQADMRRLAEPIVEMPGRFVDVVSGEEMMEWQS